MASITTRAGKGSPLTNTEVDDNFTNLNTDKIENVSEDTTPQLGGDLDTNGNDINFGDSDKAVFGAGNDLQIYHDGSGSYIKDAGTGNLVIDTDGTGIFLKHGSDNMLNGVADGTVRLYYDGSEKLATTSTGIDVTGTATMDGLKVTNQSTSGTNQEVASFRTASGGGLVIRSSDLSSSNPDSILEPFFGESLKIKTEGSDRLKVSNNGDISFYEDTGTTPKFFWDASAERLGIGTSSPDRPLHIKGSVPSMRLEDTDVSGLYHEVLSSSSTGYEIRVDEGDVASGSYFRVDIDGSEQMRIDSSGKVGIGTSSPATALDVQGTVTADGLTVDGSLGSLTTSADGARLSLTRPSANYIQASSTGGSLFFATNGTTNRQFIANNGDISFYEDTGTTPKFFWDASAESLELSGTGGLIVDADGVNGALTISNPSSDLIQFTTGTYDDIAFVQSGSETVRFDSSGRVGIGTSSPDSPLHIDNGATSHLRLGKALSFDDYTNEGAGIEFERTTGGQTMAIGPVDTNKLNIASRGGILFGVGGAGTYSATSEAMRIDSSGHLLVGKTASNSATAGLELRSEGRIFSTVSSNQCLRLNRKTSDGDIAVFQKDGSTVGSIGSYSGTDTYITGGTGNDHGIVIGDGYVVPSGSAGATNSNVNLGLSATGRQFKDLYLSGGVYLGGTGSANHLDDYEEGTWTLTNGGDSTGTVNSSLCRYTKVGRMVTVHGTATITANFTSTFFGGLPFAPAQDTSISGVHAVVPVRSNIAGRYLQITTTDITYRSNTAGSSVTPTTSDGTIRFSFSYQANA